MAQDTEKIKERLGILEVAGGYLNLEKAGKNFKARCPFHNEKTPSFHVSPERESFYCFGCHAKGDIFTFVEKIEGVDFYGALKILADRAGVEISHTSPEAKEKRDELYEVLERATLFFERKLSEEPQVQEYLRRRGVSEETASSFRLGFAPDDWRELYTYLGTHNVSDEVMRSAGLIKDSHGKTFDRFRSRLIFPIFDPAGRVVAFSGRLIGENEKAPKYLNSPDTPLFNKSRILYGFDRAKQAIIKYNFTILVEGQFDLVLSHQAGYRNTVAVSGTSFTDEHLERISRLSANILLAMDSDSAGMSSALKAAAMALEKGMDVKMLALPDGQDPADVIAGSPDEWKRLIKEAKHIIDVVLAHVKSEDNREYWKKIRQHVVPLIASMSDAIDRAHFTKHVSEVSGIPQDALEKSLVQKGDGEVKYETDVAQSTKKAQEKKSASHSRRIVLTRQLMGVIDWLEDEKLSGEMHERLKDLVGEETLEELRDPALAFEAEKRYAKSPNLKYDVEELFLRLEEGMVKSELQRVSEELREAEVSGADGSEHLGRYHELSKRLASIHQTLATLEG